MRKVGKAILISGIATTMAIGTVGMINTTNIQKEKSQEVIQAYNHTPANILDNVFVLDNNKYLPFIFTKTGDKITKEEVKSEFEKAGLEIESISTGNIIATGTTIKVKGSNEVYTVIIYGDINNDGIVNVFDALRIVEHIATDNKITGKPYEIAANVGNSDSTLNVFDALRIVGMIAGNGDPLVVQEPTSIKEQDSKAPIITIGKQNISLNFGDTTYQENQNDITANDNIDGDLSNKVKRESIYFTPAGETNRETSERVNTNRIGTYYITYRVSDNSGNVSRAERTVTIKGLTSVKVGNTTATDLPLDLYVESKAEANAEIKGDGNVYTMVPIKFYNQDGEPDGNIELKASDIQITSEQSKEGKVAIDLSNVNTQNSQKVLVKFYDDDGTDEGAIAKIGFAMPLVENKNFDISQLNGKTIKIKCRKQTITLTIRVNYKETRSFKVVTETKADDEIRIQGKNTSGNYIAGINKEVTLAIIESGSKWEKPVTQEMIDNKELTFKENFDKTKLKVRYVIEDGRILLKATMLVASDTDVYTITPILCGSEKSPLTIMGIPSEWNIKIGNEKEFENGMAKFTIDFSESGYIWEDFIVSNSSYPNGGQEVIVEEVKYEQRVESQKGNYVYIEFERDNELTQADATDPIKQILIQADEGLTEDDLPLDVVVTFTLFDKIEGVQYDKNIIIHIIK